MQREHPWTTADISAALGVDFKQYPSGSWRINEYDNVLAIFTSADPRWRNIVDRSLTMVRKSSLLSNHALNLEVKILLTHHSQRMRDSCFPLAEVALLYFIYKGKVYFATSRTLCQNKRQGVADYKALYAELKGPSMKALLGMMKIMDGSMFSC